MKKKKSEILERLESIMCEEYTATQFNSWIGFNCDFIIDELDNNSCDFNNAKNRIFNLQRLKNEI